MKKFIFILPAVFFLNVSAQEPRFRYNTPEGGFYVPLQKGLTTDSMHKISELIQKFHKDQTIGKLVYTQTNGTKIYALPKSNMPCLVPDLSKTNYNMPNAGTRIKVTGMPPGSAPPNNIIPNEK